MPLLPEIYKFMLFNEFFREKRNRPLIDYALELLEDVCKKGGLMILQLPTGYGKTAITFSSFIRAIVQPDFFWRVIHISPLRSIVNDIYNRGREGLKKVLSNVKDFDESDVEELVGPQMMSFPGSPYLQKKLVITTFDTFSLSMAKIPVEEVYDIASGRGHGHFDVPKASILESLIVMDEVHSILSEVDKTKASQVLMSMMYYLAGTNTPMLLMSATLPKAHSKNLLSKIKSAFSSLYCKEIYYGEDGVIDKDFENEQSNKEIKTKLLRGGIEEFAAKCSELATSYDRILMVLNTIPRALKVYHELIDRGLSPILLHSKFKEGDKNAKLKVLEGGKWILVSTQVVEAGVDVSAEALITDVAPANNLVQRAGRVARRPSDSEGLVVLIEESKEVEKGFFIYDDQLLRTTIEELKKHGNDEMEINWRGLSDGKKISYQKFVDAVYSRKTFNFNLDATYWRLISSFEWEPLEAVDLLLELYNGSFLRDSPLIPLATTIDSNIDLSEIWKHVVPVDLKDVEKMIERGIKINKIVEGGKVEELKHGDLKILTKAMMLRRVMALHTNEKIYNSEEGLIIDVDGGR